MLYPYWSSFKNNEQGVADQLNNCRKYVVSSSLETTPWKNSTIIKDGLVEHVGDLKKETGGYILVQGSGSLVKPLMEAGFDDELKLLVNPSIIGKGKRIFQERIDSGLELSGMQQLDKSVVLLTY